MHSLFLFTYITYICAIFKFNLINIKFPCKQDQLLLMQRQMSSPSVVDPSMMVHYQQQQQQQQPLQQPQQPQFAEQPYYQQQQQPQQQQFYDPVMHAQSKGMYFKKNHKQFYNFFNWKNNVYFRKETAARYGY